MPYTKKTAPNWVQELPDHAKSIWVSAFNNAIDEYDSEEKAFKVAIAAVKKAGYKKNKEGKWVKATEPVILSFFGPAQTIAVEGAEDDDPAIAARSEIQVMRPGKWEHPDYGEFEITQDDIDQFKDNFDSNVRGVRLAVDVNHEDEHEAVGWFEELIDKGKKGLWAVIGWTKKGYEYIKDGAYRYFSPEFAPVWADPETGEEYNNVLFGGAITNRPFIKNMAAVALSEEVVKQALDFYKEIVDDGSNTDVDKDDKTSIDFKEKAREKFGFSKDELEKILASEYPEDTVGRPPAEESLMYAISELLRFWMRKLEAGDKDAAGEVEPIINNLQSLIKKGLDKKDGDVLQTTQMSDDKGKPTPDNPEEGKDKEKIQAQESQAPEGQVMLSEDEVKKLREEAEKGAEATKKLVEAQVAGEAQTLIFSEVTKEGLFKEDSKDKLTKFMLALTEEQRKEFKEILAEIPKVNHKLLTEEKGSGQDAPEGEDKDHAQIAEEAKKLAEEKGISYTEALKEVAKKQGK